MFDDYDRKRTDKRVFVRFVQKKDEPMYPWEIAGFLNKLNTVYYKFELLNSISSALAEGISPTDIFVFDKSLPLYQRYAEMNVLAGRDAARKFYSIGLPYPLVPTKESYELHLLYRSFSNVNSFLKSRKVRPLTTESVSLVYEKLKESNLEEAELLLIDQALERADKSYRNNSGETLKTPVTEQEIVDVLEKYQRRKEKLFSDIGLIQELNDEERFALLISKKSDSKRLARLLTEFFHYFDHTIRPLVFVRIADDEYRVLGRALVNKKEKTGLEVKEVVRNSPLGTLIESGIAIYQAVQGALLSDAKEKRAGELHQLEVKSKALEVQSKALDVEIKKEQLAAEKLKNAQLQAEVTRNLVQIAQSSDISAIGELPPSFIKNRLLEAYTTEQRGAGDLLHRRGLELDQSSIRVIDTTA
ncbi:hypothetical protein GWL_29440 [Herbaspirillum sp. GW103]|uniref:hypothetical protein n=1 Tax=Herbaspirillum sp. GW103 TaxID=1175306 RepID=UPI00025E2B12|nr:hypothetical protein [Herbaspirillum sp. GW103]EIJ45916.1 hypothetical protein GWL_29440 [Herbaspirillum sp. GW103]